MCENFSIFVKNMLIDRTTNISHIKLYVDIENENLPYLYFKYIVVNQFQYVRGYLILVHYNNDTSCYMERHVDLCIDTCVNHH